MNKKQLPLFILFSFFFLFFSTYPFSKSFVKAQTNTVPGFSCYRNLTGIVQRTNQLQSHYPNLVSLIDIGDSWEKTNLGGSFGHDIYALVIENKAISEPKPNLFLISGLRANAFAPVEINLRFAEYLLSNYSNDWDFDYLLDHFAIHFIFSANPDGRAKAESQANGSGNPEDITWSKNTNPGTCTDGDGGVLLNNNFSYQWSPYPDNPCDSTFPGNSAFSENETQAIKTYLDAIVLDNPNSSLLINLESFDNFLISPYLYSKSHQVRNYDEYNILTNKLTYDSEAFPIPGDSNQFIAQRGTLVDYAHEELNMTALLYRIGPEMAGGFVSRCGYFEDYLFQQTLQGLLNAAKSLPFPLEYPAGPEIINLQVDQSVFSNIVSFTGDLDSVSYYHSPRNTAIHAMHYSIDLPPWHPDAELIPIDTFETFIDEPGKGLFTLELDKTTLLPGKHTVYIQAVAYDFERNKIDAGFISMTPIEVYIITKNFFPIVCQDS